MNKKEDLKVRCKKLIKNFLSSYDIKDYNRQMDYFINILVDDLIKEIKRK